MASQPDRWGELTEQGAAEIRSWPAVALVTSANLAAALGVSLKTLSTWRERKIGPPAEPRRGPKNSASYYSVAAVLAWLDCNRCPAWEYERAWMIRNIGGWVTSVGEVRLDLTQSETVAIVAWLRRDGVVLECLGMRWPNAQPRKFPNFQHL